MCQKMPGICRYQRNCTNCTSPLTVSTSKPFRKNSLISIYNTSIFLCHASTAFGRKRSCTLGKLSSVKKHLSQLTKHNPKCSVQNTILYHGSILGHFLPLANVAHVLAITNEQYYTNLPFC